MNTATPPTTPPAIVPTGVLEWEVAVKAIEEGLIEAMEVVADTDAEADVLVPARAEVVMDVGAEVDVVAPAMAEAVVDVDAEVDTVVPVWTGVVLVADTDVEADVLVPIWVEVVVSLGRPSVSMLRERARQNHGRESEVRRLLKVLAGEVGDTIVLTKI